MIRHLVAAVLLSMAAASACATADACPPANYLSAQDEALALKDIAGCYSLLEADLFSMKPVAIVRLSDAKLVEQLRGREGPRKELAREMWTEPDGTSPYYAVFADRELSPGGAAWKPTGVATLHILATTHHAGWSMCFQRADDGAKWTGIGRRYDDSVCLGGPSGHDILDRTPRVELVRIDDDQCASATILNRTRADPTSPTRSP